MKVIIAGSRTIEPPEAFLNDIIKQSGFDVREVVSGACPKGIDRAGEEWADRRRIHVERFPARWDRHGNAAGPLRNRDMAKYADALILIWDGQSKGSASMLREAEREGLQIFEVIKN